MADAPDPPQSPPPPPRITAAVVSVFAIVVGVASFFPWHLKTCQGYPVDLATCEYTHLPAPVHGIGVIVFVALLAVTLLGVYATWRPTKSSWRACGWAALVTGIVASASLGIDRHVATLDATEMGTAAGAFVFGTFMLAVCGVAVMAMGRHLASERLPHARVRARG